MPQPESEAYLREYLHLLLALDPEAGLRAWAAAFETARRATSGCITSSAGIPLTCATTARLPGMLRHTALSPRASRATGVLTISTGAGRATPCPYR